MAVGAGNCRFPFSIIFHLRTLQIVKNAANPAFFELKLQASQASDVEFADLPSVPRILGPKPTFVANSG